MEGAEALRCTQKAAIMFFRKNGMERYEIIIFRSDEDNTFVADVPELSGCMAHGKL